MGPDPPSGAGRQKCRQPALLAGVGSVVVLASMAACSGRDEPVVDVDRREPLKLRRALGAEPDTLDPRLAEDNAALAIAAELHEGLTRSAPDGSIRPGAAESWEVSEDGRRYLFRLRNGLKWSNGESLAAGHFSSALLELSRPDSTAPYAGLFDALRTVEAPDARHLRLTLERALPQLPALLALPAAAPRYPRDQFDGTTPVSGPFRLRERTVGERLLLERNPFYWDADSVALDEVIYLTVQDLGTELNLYRTGEIDITSEVPNTHVASLQAELPDELRITPYLGVYAYAVNMERLADRDARTALAMAVDRDRITRQVTGAGELPAYGWIPAGITGYAPARFSWQGLPYEQAADSARRLWSAARSRGHAPDTLTLCTDASANHHRTAVALADLWRTALEVETRIVELEWGVYLDTRRSPGECDLIRLGWSADFVDPEAFAGVFESSNPQNTLGYRSELYDKLLAQSRAAATPAQRMALLADAEAALLEDVAVVPVFFRVSKRLVKPAVTGVEANPLGRLSSRDLSLKRDPTSTDAPGMPAAAQFR
jgi:oligopeptide transport system substrate-binding protein